MFLSCIYYEYETTEREDLSWYLQGKVISLEDLGDGPEITEQSRMVFLEDWDEAGHVLPADVLADGLLSHGTRRQWMRETLEHMLYTLDMQEP